MEEIQPRPRKPPDTGCIILERINPGVLRPTAGFENILRFDKNVDSGDDVQVPGDSEETTEQQYTVQTEHVPGAVPKLRKSIKSGLSKMKQMATKRMTPLLEKFNI